MKLPGRRAGLLLAALVLLLAALVAVPLAVASVASAEPGPASIRNAVKCNPNTGTRVEISRGKAKAVGRVSCQRSGAYINMSVQIAELGPGGATDLAHKTCNRTKVCQLETAEVPTKRGKKYCVLVFAQYKFSPNGTQYSANSRVNNCKKA